MKKSIKQILILIVSITILSTNSYSKTLEYKVTKEAKKTHTYLGYGMLGLTSLAVYGGLKSQNDPENFSEDKHKAIGKALVITSVVSALVATYAYRDDLFDFSDGFTKKHIHAVLGLVTTGLMVYTANKDDHKEVAMVAGGFTLLSYSFTF
jgi:hypothetical protein